MPLFDLLEATLDGVFAVDRRQRIVLWNRAAREILGFEPDAVLGRSCYKIIGSVDESGCTICQKRCVTFPKELLVQLGYNRHAEPILFRPVWTDSGLSVPEKGQRIDSDRTLQLIRMLVTEEPAQRSAELLH